MGKNRATFGKLQRERDKKAKAALKRERRITRPDEEAESAVATAEPPREYDEGRLLAALAALHQSYEAGTVSPDEFELRREELTSRLRVD